MHLEKSIISSIFAPCLILKIENYKLLIMRVKYLFLAGMVCLLSCKTNNEPSEGISISVPDQQIVDSYMNDHFELDKIISIETSNDYVIGYIRRIIFHKDKLIILDGKWPGIFVVNANTGKIETHINRKGRGPGESNVICDIAYNDDLEQILAFNDYKKLLYFDLSGNFLKEENIDGLFENISYNNGNIIFYNIGEGYSSYPHTITLYNPANKSFKKLGEEKKVNFPYRGYGLLLVKSKNIWFSPLLSLDMNTLQGEIINTSYHLDVKNKLTEELKEKATSDILYFLSDTRERSILFGIQSIRETEKHLIFNTNLSDLMMMNKNTLELHRARMMEDALLGMRLINYFPHDGDDNRIMFIVQPNEWFRSKPDLQNMPENIKKQIDMVDIVGDSNPILVFYKEK